MQNGTINTYNITYVGNGNEGGTAPSGQSGAYNSSITLQNNTGILTITGYTFVGWNTAADGSGTDYAVGSSYTIPAGDTTLYAKWTINTYNVTYDGNGNTNGTTPSSQSSVYNSSIILRNNSGNLVKTGYTFAGWNTAADGSGTDYLAGANYTIPASVTTLYAKWTMNTYNVYYDGNGNTSGLAASIQNGVYNTSITLQTNSGSLTKTGYTFAGWNTAADGSGTDYSVGVSYTIPASDTMLYAKWMINSYNVSYDGNGGSGNIPATTTPYNYAVEVTVLGNVGATPLTKTGYTFAGWNTAADGSGTSYSVGSTYSMPAENVTLYALWMVNNYMVSYDGNGNTAGAVPAAGTLYNYNSTVTLLGNTGSLVKTGYTFAGWNTASDGSGTNYSSGNTFTMPVGNVTLYAVWTINNYTLTYDGNSSDGGTAPTGGSKTYSSSITVEANTFTKSDHVFYDWNTQPDGSGTTYLPGAIFSMGAQNTTLYAIWTENDYTVTYDGNGNTAGTVPVDGEYPHNTTATASVNSGNLVKTGYTFAGWNTAANGSGTAYAPGATFTVGSTDVTLYAVWTINGYTVSYDGNGGNGNIPANATSHNYAVAITVLGNVGTTPLTKVGYTFAGWNTAADGTGTGYSAGNTFSMPANNVTLYAMWIVNSYTVSYDGNGSDSGTVPVTEIQNYGTTATVSSNTGTLTKTGYTFAGWNTAMNGSGTNYTAGATFTMPTGNVTLYAKWVINAYNVTYDGNGNTNGTAPSNQTSTYNTSITLQTNSGSLTKTGYTFAGWNTAADGSGTSYAVGANYIVPCGDTLLYAMWTTNTYNVTYQGNGNTNGLAASIQNGVYNTSITLQTNSGSLTKTGYTFAGWNTAADGSGTDYSVGVSYTIPASDTMLYAKWMINSYNVSYDGNGGSGNIPATTTPYNYAVEVTALGNIGATPLTKEGYTFAGWNTAADGSGTSYSVGSTYSMPAENVTLYALWMVNNYMVKL